MLELMEQKIFKELTKEYSEFIEEEDDFTSALEHIFIGSGIPFVFIWKVMKKQIIIDFSIFYAIIFL